MHTIVACFGASVLLNRSLESSFVVYSGFLKLYPNLT